MYYLEQLALFHKSMEPGWLLIVTIRQYKLDLRHEVENIGKRWVLKNWGN